MRMPPGILLAAATLVSSLPLGAQEVEPIQLALVTPVQIVGEADAVRGLRFNLIYGRNAWVRGLDIGLVSHSTGGLSKGLAYGVVNLNEGGFTGWQNGGVNITDGDFLGLQTGLYNQIDGGEGLQWGFVNNATRVDGVQIGIVNFAESMYGLQIGLVNIIRQGGAFPVFPIVNWSF